MAMMLSLAPFFTSLHTLVVVGSSIDHKADLQYVSRVVHSIPSLICMNLFDSVSDYQKAPEYLAIVDALPATRPLFRLC